MRRFRIVGLCLVAAFALTAFAASSASALPEVGRCLPLEKGKYLDSNCTKKSSAKNPGSFEWHKNAVKKKFTSANKPGTIQLEGASGTSITCTSQTATGEFLEKGVVPSTKEVTNVEAKFNGCELPLFKAKCQNQATEGEITTTVLKGAMAYIEGKKTPGVVVGQGLAPKVKKKGFATFKCPAVGVEVYVGEGPEKGHELVYADYSSGSINQMSLHAEELYRGSKGIQNPNHKEGSAIIDNLESSLSGPKGTFEKSDQELTTETTNEEELEIKA